MSEANFTKGVWTIQFGDMVFSCDGVNNEQVAVICNEDNRDAHLIAAAPKMYDLLERLTSHDNCRKDIIHLLGEADGLLAEIRGE